MVPVFLALFASILPVDEETDVVRKLLREKPWEADLTLVTEQNRDKVFTVLRGIADGEITQIGKSSMGESDAAMVLMRLGDIPTIERQIAIFREYKGRDAWQHIPQYFEWSRQPLIIPYLAEDLFLPGSVTEGTGFSSGGEVLIPNRSTYAGLTALRIIEASEGIFSPEVKQWASDTHDLLFKDRNAFREQMRTWWKQNEEHFKNRDYAAVQPLQPEPAATPVATPALTPIPSPTAEPLPVATPSLPPVEIPPSPTPTSEVALQENRWPLWVAAGLAVAVFGAITVRFMRRRK